MTHIWPGEADEVQAQARFARSSQTGLEARPRAALHGRAKSGAGSAPLCVCIRIQAGCAGGSGAGMPAWRPRHQHSARCQACFVSCAGCGLSHGLAVHLRDPEQPARHSDEDHRLPHPSTGINLLRTQGSAAARIEVNAKCTQCLLLVRIGGVWLAQLMDAQCPWSWRGSKGLLMPLLGVWDPPSKDEASINFWEKR